MATEEQSVEEGAEGADQRVTEMYDKFRKEGLVKHSIFNDESLYELEKKRIFNRTWTFLGHASEIPDPGDYVIRDYCDNSIILIRDEEGEIHALFNACRHQGMKLCQTDQGNASHFRCPYHGWTYKNSGELIGVPLEKRAYGEGGVDHDELALQPVPQYDTYNDLIFVCLDEDAEPLEEYLGEYTFYLDLYTNRSSEGMEVYGPQKRTVNANWKLGVVNSMSDHYHAITTHQSISKTEIKQGGGGGLGTKDRYHIHAGPGGLEWNQDADYFNELYPDDVLESMQAALTEEQWKLMTESGFKPTNSSIMPNLSLLNSQIYIDEDLEVPMTYVRCWLPLGPDKSQLMNWVIVEKDAPEEFKKNSKRAFAATFGSSGMFEQDDINNWSTITGVGDASGSNDQDLKFDIKMDLQPDSEWEGPGTAYRTPFHEANARHFYHRYFESLVKGGVEE